MNTPLTSHHSPLTPHRNRDLNASFAASGAFLERMLSWQFTPLPLLPLLLPPLLLPLLLLLLDCLLLPLALLLALAAVVFLLATLCCLGMGSWRDAGDSDRDREGEACRCSSFLFPRPEAEEVSVLLAVLVVLVVFLARGGAWEGTGAAAAAEAARRADCGWDRAEDEKEDKSEGLSVTSLRAPRITHPNHEVPYHTMPYHVMSSDICIHTHTNK